MHSFHNETKQTRLQWQACGSNEHHSASPPLLEVSGEIHPSIRVFWCIPGLFTVATAKQLLAVRGQTVTVFIMIRSVGYIHYTRTFYGCPNKFASHRFDERADEFRDKAEFER